MYGIKHRDRYAIRRSLIQLLRSEQQNKYKQYIYMMNLYIKHKQQNICRELSTVKS